MEESNNSNEREEGYSLVLEGVYLSWERVCGSVRKTIRFEKGHLSHNQIIIGKGSVLRTKRE